MRWCCGWQRYAEYGQARKRRLAPHLRLFDTFLLAKRIHEGDKTVTAGMIDVVLAEVASACPELESAAMLKDALK